MGEGLYESLVREQGYHTRIYAPVGGHRDLLAYLVRRLLENGANSSFVHQLADESLTDADLLADPVAKIAAVGGTRHPSIPLPERSVHARAQEQRGLDLNDRPELERVAEGGGAAARLRAATSAAGRRAGDPRAEGLRGLVEAQHRGARRSASSGSPTCSSATATC